MNEKNHLSTPIEYEMNKITLAFASSSEEQAFKETGYLSNVGFFRASIISVSLLYFIYMLLRFWYFSDVDARFIILQDLLFAIPAISIIIASFNHSIKKYLQTAGIIIFSVCAITILSTSIIWPVSNHFFIYSIVSVTLYGYLFLRLRFVVATVIGWIILMMFAISQMAFTGVTLGNILRPVVVLILTNFAGMTVNYLFEYFTRKNYLLEKILLIEKNTHNNLLSELELKKQSSEDLIKFKAGLEENKASLEDQNLSLLSRFQILELLKEIATHFLKIHRDEIDDSINLAIKKIAEHAKVDRGYIFLIHKNENSIYNSHSWCAKGIEQKIKNHDDINNDDFKWLMERLRKRESVIVNNINQLPEQASSIKAIFSVEGVQSFILLPLINYDKLIGYLGFDSVKVERHWDDDNVYLLEKSGEIFVSVLEQKKSIWLSRKSENKLGGLIERTDDVVFITTPKGKIQEINPAGARLLGYSSVSALLQDKSADEFYADPEDRKKLQKILEEKGHVTAYEIVLKRKDGKRITVLETAKAVRDEKGDIVAYEGIMRDVTEQRQLERQLFQAQKMESIGLLAGGIAHDFNNIVTAINGYADMVLMSMNSNHEHYNNIVNILKGGKRAEKLTRQLLAFSRKQIIKPKVTNINALITELTKMLQRLIGEDIIFETNLNTKINNIKVDHGQMQQILVNLVVNARDAINEVGINNSERKVVIETNQVELDDTFVASHPGSHIGKHIAIAIKDTGIGIDEEIKSKVFEPFFTTKEEGRSSGLGLSTVYGIVKQNNGYIYPESVPGKGTTFTIYWPVAGDEKVTSVKEDTSAVVAKRKATVLVVEDDENVRELACSFLNSLGYDVLEAEDGLKAMEIVNKNNKIEKIDVLLTDIVMPGMRGDELADRIKKMRPEIEIILTSGYTDSDIIQSGIMNEHYNFLPKPYTIKQMAKKVEKALENAKTGQKQPFNIN
ncbi:MAG: response regulator [Calditrichaceae bacterium]|nr:response regulator [Calditrichaceae bacterium]